MKNDIRNHAMHDRIIKTAADLFAGKGIDRVSVREIAQKLSVTKPVLYYYFKNKEDLCTQIFMQGAKDFMQLQSDLTSAKIPIEGKLAMIFSRHLEFFKAKPKAAQFLLKILSAPSGKGISALVNNLKEKNCAGLRKILLRCEAEGEIKKGKTEDIIHLIKGVIAHLILDMSQNNAGQFDKGLPARLAGIICRGAKCLFITAAIAAAAGIPKAYCQSPAKKITLAEAVETALAHNSGVISAQKGRDIYNEKVREYWASVYPSLNAYAQYAYNLEKPSFFIQNQKMSIGKNNAYTASLEASQIIWSGGKVNTGLRMADIYSNTGEENLRSAKAIAVLTVKKLYYSLIFASATVSIQKEALDITRQHLDTINAQYAQGIASDLAVLRQKVEVANKEPSVLQAQNYFENTLLELSKALGFDPEERFLPADTFDCAHDTGKPLEDLYAFALSNKPEVRQANLAYKMAEENVKLQRSFFYPYLYAFANRQFQGQSDSGFPSSTERAWSSSAGLKLSVPIFSGGSTSSQTRQAGLAMEQALETLKETQRRIKIDVKKAWLNLAEAKERIKSQEKTLQQARQALNATETRFKNGMAGQLELNDASLALNTSQTLYTQAMHDACSAKAELEWAAGQGKEAASHQ